MTCSERVEIKVCIGLVGVCVISIISDTDNVYDDITNIGTDDWYERLPKHDAPIEGVYTLVIDACFSEDDVTYRIIDIKQ